VGVVKWILSYRELRGEESENESDDEDEEEG
jgi:hypothetical protein